jgi:hypothetical protein
MRANQISQRNLANVLNQTQRTSLLARPRPHRYGKAIDPQNQVRRHRITTEDKTANAKPRAKLLTIKIGLKGT